MKQSSAWCILVDAVSVIIRQKEVAVIVEDNTGRSENVAASSNDDLERDIAANNGQSSAEKEDAKRDNWDADDTSHVG